LFLETDPAIAEWQGASSGAVVNGYAFVSGAALDPAAGLRRLPAAVTVADEAGLCLDRIEAVLAKTGGGLGDVVKATSRSGTRRRSRSTRRA
jgi:enamine deaminase RidA (YjgF/YER057c/UK114 family)